MSEPGQIQDLRSKKAICVHDKEVAEILGNSMGDGSFVKMKSGKIRFQLRGHINEDRDHYDNFVIPTFNKKIAIPLTGKNVGILVYKKRNSYGIGTENKRISKFLESIIQKKEHSIK